MTAFNITAIDPMTGRQVQERVEADTEDGARAQVSARSLVVVDAKPAGAGLSMEISLMKKRVKPKDLAVFARQFATMINAGMPMLRSLSVLTKQTANPTLRSTLSRITNDIEGGLSLSDAIAVHDEIFPPLMVAMVKSGEVGGFLDVALAEVATSIEKDVKLRGKIKSASTYPVVVMLMGVLGTVAMLIFVVPTFTSMFTDMGGELPLPTRIVVNLSTALKYAGGPLAALLVVFSFWWGKNKNKAYVREALDPVKLRLPVFGPLVKKISLARFTRNLSVMLGSGVPILDALTVVAETAGNTVVRDAVLNSANHIRGGDTLSDHLGDGGVIPDMVVQMVAVGEDSGAMPQMLKKVAEFYEEDVESTTEQLASLLEPFLIVAMGLVLGSLVVAMYLPTFMIFDLVQ